MKVSKLLILGLILYISLVSILLLWLCSFGFLFFVTASERTLSSRWYILWGFDLQKVWFFSCSLGFFYIANSSSWHQCCSYSGYFRLVSVVNIELSTFSVLWNDAFLQIDLLENPAIDDVVMLSVVLDEVKNKNLSVYNRVRALCRNPLWRFFVFSNEHHKYVFRLCFHYCCLSKSSLNNIVPFNNRINLHLAWRFKIFHLLFYFWTTWEFGLLLFPSNSFANTNF